MLDRWLVRIITGIAATCFFLINPLLSSAQIVPAQNQVSQGPYGGIVYSTSTSGTAKLGQVKGSAFGNLLYWTGSIWSTIATSSLGLENPLTFTTGLNRSVNTVTCITANGTTFGCIPAADWTTFNNKVSSTSLSGTSPITYNSGTGAIGFDFSIANTFTGLQKFNAGASTTLFSVFNTAYFGGTATSSFTSDGFLHMVGGAVGGPSIVVNGNAGIYGAGSNVLGLAAGGNGLSWDGTSFTPNTDNTRYNGTPAKRWLYSNSVNAFFTNASTTNATTTTFAITSLTNSLLATNANGSVVATTSIGSNYISGVFSIVQGGTATSTQVTNGVNFFDGTQITSGTALTFTGTKLGIATTTPTGKLTIDQGTEAYSFYVSHTGSTTPSFVINGVNGNGYVGSGTGSPDSPLTLSLSTSTVFSPINNGNNLNPVLHIMGNESGLSPRILFDSINQIPIFNARRANGTIANPSALKSGDQIFNIAVFGYGATNFLVANQGFFNFSADGDWSDTSGPSRIGFATAGASGGGAERMRIDSSGRVGIATTSPWRTLSVTGTVAFSGLSAAAVGDSALCMNSTEVMINSGVTTCLVSSKRFKHDIVDLSTTTAIQFVKALKTSTYTYNTTNQKDIGIIAEDAFAVDPRFAALNDKGQVQSLNLQDFVAVLIKSTQSILSRLDGQDEKIAALQDRLDAQDIAIKKLQENK